ncbi:MAG: hypothetical protein LBK62_11145 [Treponema sp.]|nr:hypothetical protein [Treponema sp.]
MTKKVHVSIVVAAVVLGMVSGGLTSCGLEEYAYVEPVPQGNIVEVVLNNKATIRLPNIGSNVFTNFSLLYRIYISGQNESGQIQTSSSALSAINSTLASDYAAIYPSTDLTSSSGSTNVGSLFRSRGYYEMFLQGTEIRTLLGSGSRGKTIVIDFPPVTGNIPTLTFDGGTSYNLYRSTGQDGIQTDTSRPLPNRYFQNHADLNAGANATDKTNMDVSPNSAPTIRYAYVSLYIVSTGRDKMNPVYSNPTFIGILKLPEAN